MSHVQPRVDDIGLAAAPLGGAQEQPPSNTSSECVPSFSDSPASIRVLENGRGERREELMTDDFWEYLKYKSARRGVSTMEVFEEEEAAGKAIKALGLTDEFFASAVRRS